MKRVMTIFIALAFVMSMAAPVFAADMERPVKKFVDGFVEVIKSPMQLIKHPKATMDDADHKGVGLVKGILQSPFHMVDKAGHGLIDMVTFPIE